MIAKADLPKVEVQQKHVRESISSLQQLVPQPDSLGLKYTSVECSKFIAEAMMQNRDRSSARQELECALLLSDKLGMWPLRARAHFLLAVIARNPATVAMHRIIIAKPPGCSMQ